MVTFNGHESVLGELLVLWCFGSGMWTASGVLVWLLHILIQGYNHRNE